MLKNFIEELKWRGLLHDVMPGTEELLLKESVSGYVGFDPTAKSLTIGNLVTVMLLVHFQKSGHKPIALVGGATGMIGDPSFKNEERKFLSDEDVRFNMECIKKQLEHFLDFDENNANNAEIVNNYDWFKDISFLQFLRDVGKHLTINYMCAKDSVKKRLESGLSFTEFSYQLLQGYDFYHLNKTKNIKIQMGGSDQWGNITSGTELIRRKSGNEAYALTCPLLTKSDGTKFGKSEGQNIWLDPDLTSPYKFYQFWLNSSDEEALKNIKIFTTFEREHIENLEKEHLENPHLRILQKELAKDITCRVHSVDDYNQAIEASELLFGKGTFESLSRLNEKTIINIFEGVPQSIITRDIIENSINIVDFLVDKTNVFPSKGEARRMIKSNAVSINKNRTEEDKIVNKDDLINNKYIIVQKGKKNYHLVICE
ncbi:MAG: tyrosine--tRNA ligase [Bacteroidetes bacterium GWE2_29_8]|nr:MAG: tyrosine--tRNA ligase [Bacteroidetes bacterium GWE2_29_8]OFY24855.1 MAG: tyrosine--tRNA ligase [Bacteroidetes bacterium GWF2_29_10]